MFKFIINIFWHPCFQEEEAGQERHHGRGGGAVGVQRGVLGRQEGGQLGGQDRRAGQVVVAEKGTVFYTQPELIGCLK